MGGGIGWHAIARHTHSFGGLRGVVGKSGDNLAPYGQEEHHDAETLHKPIASNFFHVPQRYNFFP